jgi:hypothetical protein
VLPTSVTQNLLSSEEFKRRPSRFAGRMSLA